MSAAAGHSIAHPAIASEPTVNACEPPVNACEPPVIASAAKQSPCPLNARRTLESARSRRRAAGFTLLEVMIALLVIALGIGAVINTTSESGWKSTQMRTRTIASWVAQNQIVSYRAQRIWDSRGTRSGEVEMANAEWHWEMKISKTDDPNLRRLDVEVYLRDGEGIQEGVKASLTGFVARL